MATTAPRNGFQTLSPEREGALYGFLQAHVDLRRALDRELSLRHGVSLTTYEVLSRLITAEEGGLRTTQLADLSPLSLSRVSRLVDELCSRGLTERKECATDKRVSYVALTDEGTDFMRDAQKTFHATVEERFLGRLTEKETKMLSDLFARIANSGEECKTVLGG